MVRAGYVSLLKNCEVERRQHHNFVLRLPLVCGQHHLARAHIVSRLMARHALRYHVALVLLVGIACMRAVRLDPVHACEWAGLDRVFRAATSGMRAAAHILYEFRTTVAVGAVARATTRRADVELLGLRAQLGAVPTLSRKCCAPSMRETLLGVIQQQCLLSGLEFEEEIEKSDVLVEESPPRSPLHARDGSEQRAAAAPPKRRRSPSPTFDTSQESTQESSEALRNVATKLRMHNVCSDLQTSLTID